MEEGFASLFDYLRIPAGPDLGQQVYSVAKKEKIKVKSREVKTKKYEGKIIIYPVTFLNYYFNTNGLPKGARV